MASNGIDLAKMPLSDEHNYPKFFKKIHSAIEANKETEGLYRKAGNKDEVKKLYDDVVKGNYKFDEKTDPHVLTSLHKQVILNLKQPFIPLDAVIKMKSANSIEEEKAKVRGFAEALAVLDNSSASLLCFILKHLRTIANNELSKNRMTDEDLAKEFVKILFCQKSEGEKKDVISSNEYVQILLFLMYEYSKLFILRFNAREKNAINCWIVADKSDDKMQSTKIDLYDMVKKGDGIPEFFVKIISAIEAQKTTVGLYRTPESVQTLYNDVTHGVNNFDENTDPHILTTLLRTVIENLKESLISFDVFKQIIICNNRLLEDTKKLEKCRLVLDKLGGIQYRIFFALLKHFNAVADAASEKQVTLDYLASLFETAFFGHYINTYYGELRSKRERQHVLLYYMQNYGKLFLNLANIHDLKTSSKINLYKMAFRKGDVIPEVFFHIISAMEAHKKTTGIYPILQNETILGEAAYQAVYHGQDIFGRPLKPHIAATLLKDVIKYLMPPLISLDVFKKMKIANGSENKKDEHYREAVNILDKTRYNVLFASLKHFNVVTDATNENQVTRADLASLFEPIFFGQFCDANNSKELKKITYQIMLYLIQNYVKIFT